MATRELPPQLGPLDAVFLNFERREMPLHIGSVSVCDGPLPFDEFVAGIEARLDAIPRYRQKVMRPFLDIGLPTWQHDPDFDIRRHIFQVRVAAPGGEAELRELAGRIFTKLLDRAKPLWEVYVAGGLSGGRSALIVKVHHCMVDGVSGVGLLGIMFDQSPEPPPRPKRKRFRPLPPPDANRLFADAVQGSLQFSLDQLTGAAKNLVAYGKALQLDPLALPALQKLAEKIPQLIGPLERLPFNRPCSGERLVAWKEYAFADVKAIRDTCGGTVNDVVLAVLAGAVMRYLKAHGESLRNRYFRVMAPVNLRQEDDRATLGNCVSVIPVVLPLFMKDPAARLRQIAAETENLKRARVAELLRNTFAWLGALPAPLQTLAGALPLWSTPVPIFHMVVTNVHGPHAPLYAAGRRLLTLYPYVPAGWDVGLCLAVQSYDQKLFFGLTIDAQAAPDGHRVSEFLDASFRELRKAAGVASKKQGS